MLDIKFLRQNPDVVKENIKKKFQDEKLPLVDEVIELDKRNREIKGEVEALRAEKNKVSKEIGACMAHGEKEKAEELGVTPKMKIEGYAIAGYDAELMGYSPKFSSEKLANKLGVDLKSIDMFEINEAFASQAYAVSRDLGLDPEKVNIYGGGISIGHPIGATGAMLTVKVMYELMRTDKKDAMISMCIGGGQGISMYFTKCE